MASDDVLFLDDMLERHKSFKSSAPLDGLRLHRVFSAQQAIEAIREHRPNQVFLDHDLSVDDIMCEDGARTVVPTGMAVVDFIMTLSEPPMDVVIHSCNGPAAERMEARLKSHPAGIRVRRIAFPYLIHALQEAKRRAQ